MALNITAVAFCCSKNASSDPSRQRTAIAVANSYRCKDLQSAMFLVRQGFLEFLRNQKGGGERKGGWEFCMQVRGGSSVSAPAERQCTDP